MGVCAPCERQPTWLCVLWCVYRLEVFGSAFICRGSSTGGAVLMVGATGVVPVFAGEPSHPGDPEVRENTYKCMPTYTHDLKGPYFTTRCEVN